MTIPEVYLKVFMISNIIIALFIVILTVSLTILAIVLAKNVKPIRNGILLLINKIDIISEIVIDNSDEVKNTVQTVNSTVKKTVRMYQEDVMPVLSKIILLIKLLPELFKKKK